MTVINTNVSSLFAQNALKVNNRALSTAMEQLSTGTRINSAKDDAAGLSIGTTMTAQIRGMNQAVRNANDGISLLQTAEGAMIEQTNMLQRMRELAVQSVNETLDDTQRGYLNDEFTALKSQIDDVANNTTWNSKALLTGSASTPTTFTFQVGANKGNTLSVDVAGTTKTALEIESMDIETIDGASTAIEDIDKSIDAINSSRAKIGAGINRLTYVTDNLSNIIQNTSASRSQILDTDYATTTTNLARAQIIQQAGTAMLAQANQLPQSVLALLR
jgi:flagellin